MTLEVTVNGAQLDVDEEVTVPAILSELERQGWQVQGVRVDGSNMSVESALQLESCEGRVDFDAEEPTASSSSEPAVFAGSTQAPSIEPEALAAQLCSTLPQFREMAESLGDEFSRGQWRGALDRLTGWLEEFQVVLGGFQVVQGHRPEGDEYIQQIPQLLRELSEHLESQSWVEVADLLLYEFAPTIEAWDRAVQR